jgi:Na+-transporting methylmalonyl-CoA/oxaloacetate decarboxylase gamma subunit
MSNLLQSLRLGVAIVKDKSRACHNRRHTKERTDKANTINQKERLTEVISALIHHTNKNTLRHEKQSKY